MPTFLRAFFGLQEAAMAKLAASEAATFCAHQVKQYVCIAFPVRYM